MQQRSYDTGSPTPLNTATIKIPKSLAEDLKILAANDTRRLAEDLIIDTKYGRPSIERKTLAPWFTIARLVEAELVRRRKLKSWSE